jgi:hypothetical protein
MRPLITAQSVGWCYLLHMSRPLGNTANARAMAQHYSGWADDPTGDGVGLEHRIAEHLAGRGAKITRAAVAAGIEISLVATWRAPLAFEQYLKRRKEAPRLCPICCRARGRKVKHITPIVVEQLTLDLDEEMPTAAPARADWLEISTLRQWRGATVASSVGADWDDGLLLATIPARLCTTLHERTRPWESLRSCPIR